MKTAFWLSNFYADNFFCGALLSRVAVFTRVITHANQLVPCAVVVPTVAVLYLLSTAATWLVELACVGIDNVV